MNQQTFRNISKILARDSKSTTYKFALIRGVIDLISENSPYILVQNNRAHLPLSLLIEKWLIYYYPLVDIPQINGQSNLAFYSDLKDLTIYYQSRGGLSAFYNDLRNKGIPSEISSVFLKLVKKMALTIVNMPMRHIGKSIINEDYSIFRREDKGNKKLTDQLDGEYLLQLFGSFSIPLEYFEAFQVLGSFINGQDAILIKWAEFSVKASNKNLSLHYVLDEVLSSPVTNREISESKLLYHNILQSEGQVRCVWSGKLVNQYDIDHIIPFSIWKNNDLWNLLPTTKALNNNKRDKIPSEGLIDSQRDLIIHYWDIIHTAKQQRFEKEIQASLLGYNTSSNWQKTAFDQLKNSCNYLINIRGFESWNYG